MKAFRLFGMYIFRTSRADHFRLFSNILLQRGNGICHDALWPPLSPLIYIIKKECIKIHYIFSSHSWFTMFNSPQKYSLFHRPEKQTF